MNTKTFYIDIDKNRFISEQGGMLTEWPTIAYGACPTWTLKFVRPDTMGNLQPIDVTEATAWHAAVDVDFNKNTQPMIRTLDADIDKSAAASGILQMPLNANTETFEQKIGARNSLQAYFEIRGYDPSGYVIYDYRMNIYALGAVDPQGNAPLPIPSGYATEDWTMAVLRAAPEYQFSEDGETDWHSTRDAEDSYYRTRYPEGQWSEAILIVNGIPPSLSSYATIEYVDEVSGWLWSELSGGGGGETGDALTGVTLNGTAGTVTDHVAALSLDLSSYATKAELPTVNDATLTIKQGGVTKGTFTANASGDVTIDLDAGGGGGSDPNALTGVTLNGVAGTITNKVAALTLDTSTFATHSEVTAATSGKQDVITSSSKLDYSLLSGTPTIPTVNNATLTITQGGTTKGTFSANASGDVTIALDAGGGGGGGDLSFTTLATSGVVNANTVNPYPANIGDYDTMHTQNTSIVKGLGSTSSLKQGHIYAYDYAIDWITGSGFFNAAATHVNIYNTYNPVVNDSLKSELTVIMMKVDDYGDPQIKYSTFSYTFPSQVRTFSEAASYLQTRGLLPMNIENDYYNIDTKLESWGDGFAVTCQQVNPEYDDKVVCSGAMLSASDWGRDGRGINQAIGNALAAAYVFTPAAEKTVNTNYLTLRDITTGVDSFNDLSSSWMDWADDSLPSIEQISGTVSAYISGKVGERLVYDDIKDSTIKAKNMSKIGKWKPAITLTWETPLPSGLNCEYWRTTLSNEKEWLIWGTPSGVARGTAIYRLSAPMSISLTGEVEYDISAADVGGATFAGDYSEAGTLHYEGSFVPTQATVTFREWVNSATSMRTVPILSGSIHVTGQGYDWEQDQEVTIDEYRTMWLCPVGGMENYYFWGEQPDDAARQSLIENEGIHPSYSWGLYENSTAPSDILESYSAIGYFPPQTDDTLPALQSANSAWTENAGSWENVTLTVS